MTVTWADGRVSAKAWPESGWDMDRDENGPDKVSVWFWKKGEPVVHVEAWANGKTEITEIRCSGRLGTSSWHCDERKVG